MNIAGILILSILWTVLRIVPAMAHDQHPAPADAHPHPGGRRAPLATGDASTFAVKLHDLELLNQEGQPRRLATEVIADRLVVMNFIYTTCTTVCPVYAAILSQLQHRLGERLGRDVVLVSISVDPTTDTPARLKQWAERHGARGGWEFLTGRKADVDRLLIGLEAYTVDFKDHPTILLIGDGRQGRWKRFYGYPSPEHILNILEGMLKRRTASRS